MQNEKRCVTMRFAFEYDAQTLAASQRLTGTASRRVVGVKTKTLFSQSTPAPVVAIVTRVAGIFVTLRFVGKERTFNIKAAENMEALTCDVIL